MLYKKQPCAYCGKVGSSTKGHVISENLYFESLRSAKRIKVPECLECKKIWEDAEPHFRNVMTTIWNPDQIEKDDRYEKMLRSMKKCDGKRRYDDLIQQIMPGSTPNSQDVIYPGRDPRCNLILRKIVRGLVHEHKLGTAIADDKVICDVMRFSVPDAFKHEFTWHEISSDFFRYGYATIQDQGIHSFWLLKFSRHIVFFCCVSESS